ncbi:phage tail protein [Brenneria populi subsp. brevivirga]|uniref:phage baseplate protein n=1 Tax=Brenneria populi TaxID=1505588 RepID=UPI002E16E081|nr:phage tail protein [Brenneria populi subsp. brevivirga]
MQKISFFTDTADGSGEFTNGSVANGVSPTLLEAGWHNCVQREIVNVIEGANIELSSSNDHQLLDAINSLISGSIINNIYPIGSVKFFASTVNPNALFSGTTWQYIGEDKTIRLAATDGSDVLETGGSDNVVLTEDNLPAHTHTFSGTTESDGEHTHNVKNVDNGNNNSHGWYGEEGAGLGTVTTTSSGDHTHVFSGTTDGAGNGTTVNITNSYVRLMGWYRTA